MATNEIVFLPLVLVIWGLSLVAAYFFGKDTAFRYAKKYAQDMINQAIDRRLEELKKQPPIR